jgi:hypothetical protein
LKPKINDSKRKISSKTESVFLMDFAGSKKNHKKIIATPNQPTKTKFFSEKVF